MDIHVWIDVMVLGKRGRKITMVKDIFVLIKQILWNLIILENLK